MAVPQNEKQKCQKLPPIPLKDSGKYQALLYKAI